MNLPIDLAQVQNVLILRTDHLGDLLLHAIDPNTAHRFTWLPLYLGDLASQYRSAGRLGCP